MLGFVAVDCDVPESGSREMCLQFIGGVGVHTLDHLLPFLVIAGEAIIFVDDEEFASGSQHTFHLGKTLLNVRPEIDRLKGGGHYEGVVLEW